MPTLVDEVMSSPARTVQLTAPRSAIVKVLAGNRIGAVPVVDGSDHVVGVVSESDLMPTTPAGQVVDEPGAGAIMRAPAITVQVGETLFAAGRRMRERQVHHLPVVDCEGRAVGMLSRGDLLKVFTQSDDAIRQAVVQGLLVGHLWVNPSDVAITVRHGIVSLRGKLPRRSDVMRFERLLPTVDGVVGVKGRLDYRFNDLHGAGDRAGF